MSEVLLQIHEPGETPLPHDDARGLAVGVDLGTTNSVVAIAHDQKPEVLRDETGQGLVPSIVAYRKDGQIIVGDPARRLLLEQPEIVVGSIKRLMGRGAEDLKSLAGSLPYELAPAANGGMVRLKVGERVLTPVEVSADILRAVKMRAEVALQDRRSGAASYRGPYSGLSLKVESGLFPALFMHARTFVQKHPRVINLSPGG